MSENSYQGAHVKVRPENRRAALAALVRAHEPKHLTGAEHAARLAWRDARALVASQQVTF